MAGEVVSVVTCKDVVKEAVANLGRVVSTGEVIDYVYNKYPDKPWKASSIRCHLIGLSLNHPTSRHYPTLHRQACLFWVGRGRYRLYDPTKDGKSVVEDRQASLFGEKGLEDIEREEISGEAMISLERDLEEYILRNLNQIEDGLRLYSKKGIRGRQLSTDVGRIDILAVDKNDDFVVIELKAGTANYPAIGQILGYISWVRQNIAKNKKVGGIIIADDFGKKLKYASSETTNVSLKTYEVNFTFKDVQNDINQ